MPKIVSEKKAKIKKPSSSSRTIIYPKPAVMLYDGNSNPRFTADLAKKLIGWKEESDTEKFGKSYSLLDEKGNKIRLTNNPSNRPFRRENALRVKQEILRKRWKLNLESMIIGKTGICISCQHRLVGLILAAQEWEMNKDQWPEWDEEPNIQCLVAFGCDESDEVVNTIDTGIPRSLADVIYRTGYFAKYSDNQREQASKMLDNAVKFLWERTGEVWNPWSPYRTHAESLAFIERFPRLVDCVNHIYVENAGTKKKISSYITTGIASGLLYLMGSSKTPSESYEKFKTNESDLNWDRWDAASNFWVNVAAKSKETLPLTKALGQLSVEGAGGSKQEKIALIIKAWDCIVANKPITAKDLALKYEDVGDIKELAEMPLLGGIDSPIKSEPPEDEEE